MPRGAPVTDSGSTRNPLVGRDPRMMRSTSLSGKRRRRRPRLIRGESGTERSSWRARFTPIRPRRASCSSPSTVPLCRAPC
jgi:hypothetical protein